MPVNCTAPPPVTTTAPDPTTRFATIVVEAGPFARLNVPPGPITIGPERFPPVRSCSVPAEVEVVPVNVLALAMARSPKPSFVSERPGPEIGPLTRRVVVPDPLATVHD